jgi:hypothetical protein
VRQNDECARCAAWCAGRRGHRVTLSSADVFCSTSLAELERLAALMTVWADRTLARLLAMTPTDEQSPDGTLDGVFSGATGAHEHRGERGRLMDALLALPEHVPRPLLLGGRKFDLRCYFYITSDAKVWCARLCARQGTRSACIALLLVDPFALAVRWAGCTSTAATAWRKRLGWRRAATMTAKLRTRRAALRPSPPRRCSCTHPDLSDGSPPVAGRVRRALGGGARAYPPGPARLRRTDDQAYRARKARQRARERE